MEIKTGSTVFHASDAKQRCPMVVTHIKDNSVFASYYDFINSQQGQMFPIDQADFEKFRKEPVMITARWLNSQRKMEEGIFNPSELSLPY